jgi:hypothetical protein
MQDGMCQCGKKPTLLDLRERYGVGIIPLADRAGVAPSVVYCMLLGRPVDRDSALSVLGGLNKLIGVNYGLGDVNVPLL